MLEGSTSLLPQIDPTFKPHWVEGLSNEEYHSDKSCHSSSGNRIILDSPRAFFAYQTKETEEQEEKSYFKLGTAVHMALLEQDLFKKFFVVSPKFSGEGMYKSKEAWMSTLPPGALVLSKKEYEKLLRMVDSVLAHSDACLLLKHGFAEISGYYPDPITGIKCRFRPDKFNPIHMANIDIKTTRGKIDERSFANSIYSWKYHAQMAMYCDGIKAVTGKKVDFPAFLCIQSIAPFECALYIADDKMMSVGHQEYKRGLSILNECIKSNIWPGFQPKMQDISLPKWVSLDSEIELQND